MKIRVTAEIAKRCELLFQNGGGRAQVYNPDDPWQCLYGCERPSEAIRYARDNQVVYHRARAGTPKYDWFKVKEAK